MTLSVIIPTDSTIVFSYQLITNIGLDRNIVFNTTFNNISLISWTGNTRIMLINKCGAGTAYTSGAPRTLVRFFNIRILFGIFKLFLWIYLKWRIPKGTTLLSDLNEISSRWTRRWYINLWYMHTQTINLQLRYKSTVNPYKYCWSLFNVCKSLSNNDVYICIK
jgi:hypothetical protein